MAMWLDDFRVIDTRAGRREVKADIESDTTPEDGKWPLSGANIEGLSDSDILTKGSSIFCIDTKELYFMNSSGMWV